MTVIKEYSGGAWNTIVVGATGTTGGTGATGATGDWSSPQTIKEISATLYPVIASDVGKMLKFSAATAVSVSVPTGLGLSAGHRIDLLQYGAGQVTIGGAATIRYTNTLKLRARYSAATLICLGGNEFVLVGDLAGA